MNIILEGGIIQPLVNRVNPELSLDGRMDVLPSTRGRRYIRGRTSFHLLYLTALMFPEPHTSEFDFPYSVVVERWWKL